MKSRRNHPEAQSKRPGGLLALNVFKEELNQEQKKTPPSPSPIAMGLGGTCITELAGKNTLHPKPPPKAKPALYTYSLQKEPHRDMMKKEGMRQGKNPAAIRLFGAVGSAQSPSAPWDQHRHDPGEENTVESLERGTQMCPSH